MEYSNPLIEAIKAKIQLGWRVRFIIVPLFRRTDHCARFAWTDGIYLYDFHSDTPLKSWMDKLIFEGRIRKQPYSTYVKWKRTNEWSD